MTVETGEIHIITKECIRTKDPNNNSDTETGTLSSTGLLDMEINQLQTCRKLPSKSQVFQTNEAKGRGQKKTGLCASLSSRLH